MATIQKISNKKGNSYRVLIRNKNLPAISKTFSSKPEAKAFISELKGSREIHLYYGNKVNKLSFYELTESYLLNAYLGTKLPLMLKSYG